MYANGGDLVCVGETQVLPILAAIGRAIDTAPVGQIFTQLRLARTHVQHVRI